MKARTRMEEGRITDTGDREGHLGARNTRVTGKKQKWKDWFMERNEQEMMFVRKVALLTEKLLSLRYFKQRGSKDSRAGIYPFLKVPQLPTPAGVEGGTYPWLLRNRKNRKAG